MDQQREQQHGFTFWRYGEFIMEPMGPIGIITQQMENSFADKINRSLRRRREERVKQHPELTDHIGYLRSDYRIHADLGRYNTGEGKAELLDSVRGHDLYIITDVLNDSIYMNRFCQTVSLSPDDHYMDLVRLVSATQGTCKRVNVIMPYLPVARRMFAAGRKSLDCANILQELFNLGVENIFTYDAYDGRIANAVPRKNFENFPTFLPLIEKFLTTVTDLSLDEDHFMVISPTITDISRAIYYATLMKVPLGAFYPEYEADGSTQLAFLGDSVAGRDLVITTNFLNRGEQILDCAEKMKTAGGKRIYILTSFALFTEGYEKMNQAYDAGIIEKVFATNLTRNPRPLMDAPWFEPVDMTGNLATIIDALNHSASLSRLFTPSKHIHSLITHYRNQQDSQSRA